MTSLLLGEARIVTRAHHGAVPGTRFGFGIAWIDPLQPPLGWHSHGPLQAQVGEP